MRDKTPLELNAEVEKLRQCIAELEATNSRLRQDLPRNEHRITQETFHDGIWIIDRDSCTIFVNSRMAAMLGYTVEEMVGKYFFSFVDENDIDRYRRNLERCQQEYAFEFLHKDGTRVYTLLEANPLTDKAGNYAGVVAAVIDITKRGQSEPPLIESAEQDITERKRTEEALRESEERYRLLVESAPIGIFRTISHGERQAMSVNSALAHILGYKSPEDTVQSITNLGNQLYVRPERRQEFLQVLRAQGHVENFDYEAYTADGRQVWLSMNARIAHADENGTLIIEGFTTDITERKRAEQLLQEKVDELERFNRLMVGRELQMIKLKQEINQFCDQLGKPPRYALEFATMSTPESHENRDV